MTGDHSTPVLYGDHSCEPVPFVITKASHAYVQHYNDYVAKQPSDRLARPHAVACISDSVEHYSEISASKGALGRFPGSEMMGVIKRFRDYSPSKKEHQ